MTSLPSLKQIYMVGGYMLNDNSIIYFIIYNPIMWIVGLWIVGLIASEIYHRRKYGKYDK